MSRNVSKPPIRVKYEPITIKEPYKADIIEFDSPDEFNVYYREHESEMRNLSTLRLNQTYKIPGYRISVVNRGKDNEELILKKDYYGRTVNEPRTDDSLKKAIEVLTSRIVRIEEFLQQIC